MARVFAMGEEARRELERRLTLRRISRRQRALRRSWYRLSPAEVGADLVTIGYELLAAAPLFLPTGFDSGGEQVGGNGVGVSRNGKHGETSESAHHDCAANGTAWRELVRLARDALRELEDRFRELSQDAYQN